MNDRTNNPQQVELADILSSSKEELTQVYKFSPVQLKAINDIILCRTSGAGGHINYCNNANCGHKEQSYNSCRNRHCPKCQFIKQEMWVDKLKGRLIPGRYFHIVFTIPQQLHSLFYINQEKCYNVLFQSAKEALVNAGKNISFLGAQVGAVAILHTWGQTLTYHPHIHMLVPAGGLSEDNTEWITSPRKFFVPVKGLSAMFRGILIRKIKSLIQKDKLYFPTDFPGFIKLKEQLYLKNWNVYSKKARRGINSVLAYLGRYTHRVAITNSRLKAINNRRVCFRYKDNKKGGRQGTMELDVIEFARRFLQHILPSNFYKIRYFGILAIAHIYTKREQSIVLVGKTMWLPVLEGLTAYEVLRDLTGRDPLLCSVCKKGLMTRCIGIRQNE